MTPSGIVICAGVGLVGALLAAKGRHPLLKLQRAIVVLRAAGYLAQSMCEAAWERRGRWREMRAKAEGER